MLSELLLTAVISLSFFFLCSHRVIVLIHPSYPLMLKSPHPFLDTYVCLGLGHGNLSMAVFTEATLIDEQ